MHCHVKIEGSSLDEKLSLGTMERPRVGLTKSVRPLPYSETLRGGVKEGSLLWPFPARFIEHRFGYRLAPKTRFLATIWKSGLFQFAFSAVLSCVSSQISPSR